MPRSNMYSFRYPAKIEAIIILLGYFSRSGNILSVGFASFIARGGVWKSLLTIIFMKMILLDAESDKNAIKYSNADRRS